MKISAPSAEIYLTSSLFLLTSYLKKTAHRKAASSFLCNYLLSR